jgi:hypothetical protein
VQRARREERLKEKEEEALRGITWIKGLHGLRNIYMPLSM